MFRKLYLVGIIQSRRIILFIISISNSLKKQKNKIAFYVEEFTCNTVIPIPFYTLFYFKSSTLFYFSLTNTYGTSIDKKGYFSIMDQVLFGDLDIVLMPNVYLLQQQLLAYHEFRDVTLIIGNEHAVPP